MLVFSANKGTTKTFPYTAQAADTLYKISKYFNITLDDLLEANPHIDPDNLRAGEKLHIPFSLQNLGCSIGSVFYTIEKGDTIYKLSKRFNTKISALLKANPHINPDALLPGQPICIPQLWSKYSSKNYKISFLYPIRWAKVSEFHYAGIDGFFRLSALKSDKELEEICKAEAYHKLKPYGTQPEIVPTTAAGNKACLVIPSSDQPMEMKKQAALAIKYPNNLDIDGQCYTHMMLWADIQHMNDIINSIALETT